MVIQMYCHNGVVFIFLFILALIVRSIATIPKFNRYCSLMAKHGGEIEKLHSLDGPDGGYNWYRLEKLSGIWSKEYEGFDDDELMAIGEYLYSRMPFDVFLFCVCISLIVFVSNAFC